MNNISRHPPGIEFQTPIDSFYWEEDQNLFPELITQFKIASTSLADRFYHKVYDKATSLEKIIYTIVLTLLFPLGIFCLFGASQATKLQKIREQQLKVTNLWAQRQSIKLECSQKAFVSGWRRLYALVGGKEAYDCLPREHEVREDEVIYRTTLRNIEGIGINCFDATTKRKYWIKYFVEDRAQEERSVFDSSMTGAVCTFMLSNEKGAPDMSTSCSARYPNQFERLIFELTRYGVAFELVGGTYAKPGQEDDRLRLSLNQESIVPLEIIRR